MRIEECLAKGSSFRLLVGMTRLNLSKAGSVDAQSEIQSSVLGGQLASALSL